MGALCGKESKDSDPFAKPGRTIGSAPPPQSRSSVPKITGQGQTLGGPTSGRGGGDSDARSAAAKAAEERASKVNQPKGKLGRDLAAQKNQTRTGTLEAGSREERMRREADQSAEVRNFN